MDFLIILIIIFVVSSLVKSSKKKGQRQKQNSGEESAASQRVTQFGEEDIPVFEWEANQTGFPAFDGSKPQKWKEEQLNMEGEPVASHEGPCSSQCPGVDGHWNYGEGVSYNKEVFQDANSVPGIHVPIHANITKAVAEDIAQEKAKEWENWKEETLKTARKGKAAPLFSTKEDLIRAVVLGDALGTPRCRQMQRRH